MEQMTPEKIDQNHAQNIETGDNGETGVIFSNEGGRETSRSKRSLPHLYSDAIIVTPSKQMMKTSTNLITQ